MGVELPLAIGYPFPKTSISGSMPNPKKLSLKELSSGSLLVIVTVAVLLPATEGLKVILKVVVALGASVVLGELPTVKSPASVPVISIDEMVSVPVPLFSMVKSLLNVPLLKGIELKSVPLLLLTPALFGTLVEPYLTLISGVWANELKLAMVITQNASIVKRFFMGRNV